MRSQPEMVGERGQLREEAAVWFARMRGPHAERDRAEFERWLARGALHRVAYNRMAELFAAGRHLNPQAPFASTRVPNKGRLAGAVALLACFMLAVLILHRRGTGEEPDDAVRQVRRVLAAVEAQRWFRLVDGSVVTLDEGGVVAVEITRRSRTLRLSRGRARFDVAKERRPFRVVVGDAVVTARGTLFDVTLLPAGHAVVRLLRGTVTVVPSASPAAVSGDARILKPGESLLMNDGKLALPTAGPRNLDWGSGLETFDRATLAEIAAQANRRSVEQIATSNPRIARLTVTGTFSVADPDKLAERLATLFDLHVDRQRPGTLTLRFARENISTRP